MAKRPGSIWVEGSDLHYVDSAGNERSFTGDNIGAPAGALSGSLWLDTSDNRVHYIAGGGAERVLPAVTAGLHTDAAAIQGSVWVEGDFLHAILTATGVEGRKHADVAHSDTAHSDTAHNDTAHTDHSDTAHDDSLHGDTAHSDTSHGDGNSHCDAFEDGGGAGLECFQHCDHADGTTHGDAHNDHNDSAGTFVCHLDSGGHSDVAHSDTPHSDTAHVDHSDTTHDDVAHSDVAHGDGAHSDTPHDDRPVLIGP